MARLPRFLRRRRAADTTTTAPATRTAPPPTAPAARIERAVYDRFLAYAEAAWPNEIGGMLRCEPTEDGGVHITDLIILPQQVSRVTFDLDEEALARFMLDLARTGRAAEIREWSSLIHSHPQMPPFLSGRDRANIIRLAGERHAWSLICSVWPDRERNWCALHYHQSGPVPLTIHEFPVEFVGTAWTPSPEDRAVIASEVAALTTTGRATPWDRHTGRDHWQDEGDSEDLESGTESEWDAEWDGWDDDWDDADTADDDAPGDAQSQWEDDLWEELGVEERRS